MRGRVLLGISDDPKTDDQAVEVFQDAINRDGSFAFAHSGLSQAYWSRWKHTRDSHWLDLAQEVATRAAAIDPKCDQAHVALALVLRARQRKGDSVVEARRAVDSLRTTTMAAASLA